ncbi:MAG: hypothetical protein AAF471_06640 [Myxococcota bacterium]
MSFSLQCQSAKKVNHLVIPAKGGLVSSKNSAALLFVSVDPLAVILSVATATRRISPPIGALERSFLTPFVPDDREKLSPSAGLDTFGGWRISKLVFGNWYKDCIDSTRVFSFVPRIRVDPQGIFWQDKAKVAAQNRNSHKQLVFTQGGL